jgi:hypothetical protein
LCYPNLLVSPLFVTSTPRVEILYTMVTGSSTEVEPYPHHPKAKAPRRDR